MSATDFEAAREAMVEGQLRRRGISDPAILEAFGAVPREMFVDPAYAADAYGDYPLPIAAGQTISQPYIVALMIAEARIGPHDKVLEVGAGSGYAAAVMSRIARRVVAIERHAELAEAAAGRLATLGHGNVRIVHGDGSLGFEPEAPYDAILAAAAGTRVPQALVDQLAPGGRIVIPLGEPAGVQELVRVTKGPGGSIERAELGAVRFVPLIGGDGQEQE